MCAHVGDTSLQFNGIKGGQKHKRYGGTRVFTFKTSTQEQQKIHIKLSCSKEQKKKKNHFLIFNAKSTTKCKKHLNKI